MATRRRRRRGRRRGEEGDDTEDEDLASPDLADEAEPEPEPEPEPEAEPEPEPDRRQRRRRRRQERPREDADEEGADDEHNESSGNEQAEEAGEDDGNRTEDDDDEREDEEEQPRSRGRGRSRRQKSDRRRRRRNEQEEDEREEGRPSRRGTDRRGGRDRRHRQRERQPHQHQQQQHRNRQGQQHERVVGAPLPPPLRADLRRYPAPPVSLAGLLLREYSPFGLRMPTWTRTGADAGLTLSESSTGEGRAPLRGMIAKPIMRDASELDLDECIMALRVINCDALEDNPRIVHPMLRVHFVDERTGTYVVKQTALARAEQERQMLENAGEEGAAKYLGSGGVCYPEEMMSGITTQTSSCVSVPLETIPPISTRPTPLTGSRNAPEWGEELQIREGYPDLVREHVLMLFEVLDYGRTVSMNKAQLGDGLYPIAWGFFRVENAAEAVVELPPPDDEDASTDADAEAKADGLLSSLANPVTREKHDFHAHLQLYRWKPDSKLVRWQAAALGLDGPIAPFAAPVPPVYLQYLRISRNPYPSTLRVQIGPRPWPRSVHTRSAPLFAHEMERRSGKDAALRAMMGPLNIARSLQRAQDGKGDTSDLVGGSAAGRLHLMRRLRKEQDPCLVPNQLHARVNVGQFGALRVAFSHTGHLLAVAACENLMEGVFCVKLYDPNSTALVARLPHIHHGPIYDLAWSANDEFLASACGDGSCRVWDVSAFTASDSAAHSALGTPMPSSSAGLGTRGLEEDEGSAGAAADSEGSDGEGAERKAGDGEGGSNGEDDEEEDIFASGTPSQQIRRMRRKKKPFLVADLVHSPPTYIYGVVFKTVPAHAMHESSSGSLLGRVQPPHHNVNMPFVFTAAFDGKVRMWDAWGRTCLGTLAGTDLVDEERSHPTRVTALAVDHRSGNVVSGDGDGGIAVWKRNAQGSHPEQYTLQRRLQHMDLVGNPINSITLSIIQRPYKMLVMTQNNVMRVFDLGNYKLLNHGLAGLLSGRSFQHAGFSPDGTYVVSGDTTGRLSLWNASTGKIVHAPISTLDFGPTLRDVAWHPAQHMLAVAVLGENSAMPMYFTNALLADEGRGPTRRGSLTPIPSTRAL